MDRIGDAFVWPVRDADWFGKVVIVGLTLLVPIAGQINGLGWMLAAIDRLRAGDHTLPPATFGYLGRGVGLFVVTVVYALALAAAIMIPLIPSLAIYGASGGGPQPVAAIAGALVLDVLVFSVGTLGWLAFTFAMPAIILETDRRGIGGGLNVADVWRRARSAPVDTLIAGLMLIAAGLVGQFGAIACVVGVVFTSAYALAIQAWIVHSYEVGATAAPAAAT